MDLVIKVNDQFSHCPGGRFASAGEHSAEEFRENILLPAFRDDKYERIIVNLDGTAGFAASFLEEAFGGLARVVGKKEIGERLFIISNETPRYAEEAWQDIKSVEKE